MGSGSPPSEATGSSSSTRRKYRQTQELPRAGKGPSPLVARLETPPFREIELSCIPYLYTESLEAIDAATGQKIPIKSAHCGIMVPW